MQLPDMSWCHLESLGTMDRGPGRSTRLLPLENLSLARIGAWFDLAARLGPLPYVAISPTNVLQADALLLTTALEGLHRRLSPDRRAYSPLSKSALERAMRAARTAGVEALRLEGLSDDQTIDGRLASTLSHFGQLSYRERLDELCMTANDLAPGLLGAEPSQWISKMVRLRNEQSHQLESVDVFEEREVGEYHILTISARWLMTLVILQAAGVDRDELGLALHSSNTFAFALANMDVEGLWTDWSALATFRDSKRGGP